MHRLHRRRRDDLGARADGAARRRRASSPRTATSATGRTWTPSATRWCWRSSGPRGSRRGRCGERAGSGLPLLRRAAHADVRRPRPLAARELAARPSRTSTRPSLATRCMRTSAASASSSSSASSPRRRTSSRTTSTSRPTRTAGSSTRGATSSGWSSASASTASSSVVEIASNDGYLLQWFQERGVPVLGVEPARNVAAAAEEKGIPTVVRFFGRETAERAASATGTAPTSSSATTCSRTFRTLNDFVDGLRVLLAPRRRRDDGVPAPAPADRGDASSTRSTTSTSRTSRCSPSSASSPRTASQLFDVEELPTHGGSLRIYAAHAERRARRSRARRRSSASASAAPGSPTSATYAQLRRARARGASASCSSSSSAPATRGAPSSAYGAAAKGVTLLNYCGVGPDLVEYVVDRSPHKQGLFLPGVRLPIRAPERVAETKPDYLLILAWNLKDEIVEQMAHVREWGCRFVTPIPRGGRP